MEWFQQSEGEFDGLWPGLTPDNDFDATPEPARWAALYFPERTTMYKHTTTLTYTTRGGILPSGVRRDLIDTLAHWGYTNAAFEDSAEPIIDPNARITNDRLKAYHARMKAAGFVTSEARHAVIELALGFRFNSPASALTNSNWEKVMSKLDEIYGG